MTDPRTTTFIEALRTLERDGRVEPIAELFSDDAELGNVTLGSRFRGREGAMRFWTAYRASFVDIESDFGAVVAADGAAALEWRSKGTLAGGREFSYEGVSLVEWDGERIRRFAAYFDSAAVAG